MKTNILGALGLVLLLVGCSERPSRSASTAGSTNTAIDTTTKEMVRDADNTGRNIRDRDDATLTPGDQGNSPTDRAITQKIRKAVVSGPNDYSVIAKNIKIVTVDGKVTLRGPVKTETEKSGIVSLAKNIAGEANVDDQLEVKANP